MVNKFREEALEMRKKRKALALKHYIFPILLLSLCTLLTVASTIGIQTTEAKSASPPTCDIEIREVWIPMPDGIRLAADLFVPKGGKPGERFPVLWEYYPYRKDEDRGYNYSMYSYFVQRGYVVARVDIRGTGSSEGTLVEYEYSEQEQRDAEVVIEWLSKQPFSTGKVGMFGISWGGFNSIHMAMRNPPALKAIIAVMATDDLFQDDVHYIDGMMHLDSYEFGQDLMNVLPAPPDYVIDEKYFRERFETTPWLLKYKRQQRDGPFWDRASLNVRYESIKIPTFLIGGWYDGYRDSVPRMLEHIKAPVKGIIGPWAHSYPHWGYPKPHMEWRHEAVRWFDHWLKGRDTGIMEEPRFAVYVRNWHPPDPNLEEVPGTWRWEEGWPLARTQYRTLHPQPDHSLAESVPDSETHCLRYIPTVGIEASGPVMWWGDLPPDQRPVDTYSLVYDTNPLQDNLEILGFPQTLLNVSADAPLANWIVRLSDVAPDGTVTLVAGAGLNGAQRESAEDPKPLKPGQIYPLEIEMHFTSWVFPKGHRIRLAINNSQWPMIWPTPYSMTTSLLLGEKNPTRVVLPVVPHEDRPKPNFQPPVKSPTLPGYKSLTFGDETRSGYAEIENVQRDYRRLTTKIMASIGSGAEYPWGSTKSLEKITHQAQDDHPDATSVVDEFKTTFQLGERVLTFEGIASFRSDQKYFYYTYTRRLWENDRLLREKTWEETIPRDYH
jgi:predicted acyl esterase